VLDRGARKDLEVQPRQFSGRLLHEIGPLTTRRGEIYLELYLNAQDPANQVSLYRRGSWVVPALSDVETFVVEPWTSGFLQGIVIDEMVEPSGRLAYGSGQNREIYAAFSHPLKGSGV
jgi:hypothetical protein